ncbi:thiopeptide-type bacteriocin biosynthesis protein [Pedobacter sp. AK017]|uniref:lantibiotic dehydratase n=1 Tax=Pedobacter sp. AK017 TaxID=2723073 RepID=UPI00160AECC3|nr:lantibiotic dehydratase [Pedobacter sp. AK017]MBB5441281.1 thiopeptide-type bacteriocin biosynthesis protein [Pedobacter sp. AK017]
MKLNIHQAIIFRTPQFPLTATLAESWDELKASIAVSSTDFYAQIKDFSAADLHTLPEKIQHTLWKYFNRAKYRSTPYGTFSGVGMIDTTQAENAEQIIIEDQQIVHKFADWPEKDKISFPIKALFEKDCALYTNSSFYSVQNIIRFIAFDNKTFELVDIDHNEFALKVLKACTKPIKLSQLVSLLNIHAVDLNNFYDFLADLIDLQLLFTAQSPNIIGQDYFQRIDFPIISEMPLYLLTERKAIAGNINTSIFKELPSLCKQLPALFPALDGSLSNFITRFTKKFDLSEVPLMVALDPELGIGYDELEQSQAADPFVAEFASRSKKKDENAGDLFKKFMHLNTQTEQGLKIVQVDGYLDGVSDGIVENKMPLPNSFNAMVSVADDLVIVEYLGGATANSLTGRFTMANTDIHNHAKAIAAMEQAANPDVLFFDIAYVIGGKIDNVNRRKAIYDYQLSILNYDTSLQPLLLNDLFISVVQGDLILRSKRLNKRLIPKMASAYNYTRSDLSVFRFLCDLQNQGIHPNLNFSISSVLPNLTRYPRIQYKNIVLSLAKWSIELKELLKSVQDLSLSSCRRYLKELGIEKHFKTGMADQTLCFDMEQDDDINAFIQMLQKQKSLQVEEALLPTNSCIKETNGNAHTGQFVLSLTHNQEIYRGISSPNSWQPYPPVQAVFPPGSEWLYFEIYCHPQRADQLLSEKISTYLQTNGSLIKKWFFIRYTENGPHLRLRLELNQSADGQRLITSLSNALKTELEQGLVADLQLKSYKREMERYGADMIELVESHFCADSQHIFTLLQNMPSVIEKYALCSALVSGIQEAAVFDNNTFRSFTERISGIFNQEHTLEPADFKKLNNQYQEYRKAEQFIFNAVQQHTFNKFLSSFISVLNACPPSRKLNLFADLLHMHVNRLFNQDQRTHEMVMYYFLTKDLLRQKAMETAHRTVLHCP